MPGTSIGRGAHKQGVPQKHKIEVLPPVVHPCANTFLNFASVHIGQPAPFKQALHGRRSLGNYGLFQVVLRTVQLSSDDNRPARGGQSAWRVRPASASGLNLARDHRPDSTFCLNL